MITINALDWWITGKGLSVGVDAEQSSEVRAGDEVSFIIDWYGLEGNDLITSDAVYVVTGVEEIRCLADHGPRNPQCVTGRMLFIREADES